MTHWKELLKQKTALFIYYVNNLNRQQLAVLSTFFTLGFLILLLLNMHLYPHFTKDEKGIEVLVSMKMEEALLEEAVEKETEKNANTTPEDRIENFESNQSFNTQSKATYVLNSQKNISNSEGEGAGGFEKKLKDLAQKKQQAIDSLNALPSDIQNMPSKTRVYFSLFERTKSQLPIPVYTCKQGGKVVVNIKVNPKGEVLSAEINKALSGTENGCLLENALKYAAKSSFNTSKGNMQWGTITYYFEAK